MEQNNVTEIQEEILIENRFILEENDIREYTSRLFFSPFIIALLVFLMISCMVAIISYFFTHDTADLIQAISTILCIALYFYLCRRRTTLGILRAKERSNGNPYPITTKVHDEGIMVGEKREESARLSWYDLRPKVYESRHLLFLRTKGYQLVIFKKGAYTLGDEEDLKDLLAAKGFKVK